MKCCQRKERYYLNDIFIYLVWDFLIYFLFLDNLILLRLINTALKVETTAEQKEPITDPTNFLIQRVF